MLNIRAFAAVLLLLPLTTWSEEPATGTPARIVRILDGDTVEALLEDKTRLRVRLESIDAPEKKQAFSARSSAALAELVFGKDVKLVQTGKDRYGRTLAWIHVGGKNVNEEQVRNGWAWHYRKYSKSPSLQVLEDEARKARRGLWADDKPTPPWEFRSSKKASSRSS